MTPAGTQKLVAIQKGGNGKVATAADTFTANIIEQFINENDVSELSKRAYRNAINDFAKFLTTTKTELSEVSLFDYREFLKKNRTPRGAKLYFNTAQRFTKWLAWRGYIPYNYGEMLKGVYVDLRTKVKDSLTLDESCKVLESMTGTTEKELRDKAIVAVLLTTGIRVSSLVALNFGDLERRKGVWTMKIWAKGHDGKDATVVLPDETKRLVDDYLATRGKIKTSDPLFISTSRRCKGQRLQTQTISRMVKEIFNTALDADTPRLTCHSCRATCATLAATEAGVDIEKIAECLLHASSSTTRIYIKSSRALENPTSRAVADLIFSHMKGVAA